MEPVLTKFKNRVLFIKHNLNAQAIASLKGTEIELGGEIGLSLWSDVPQVHEQQFVTRMQAQAVQ